MLIGFNLPLSGPTASAAMLARLAAEGEAIGYDYAAISDHIVEPTDIHARYPYTESGEFPARLARRAPRAADCDRLSGRQDLEDEVPDLGDGGAASAGRAHGKDARHHRRDVRRTAYRRGRRRLARGGIRGDRCAAEEAFLTAIAIARRQKARSFELQAAHTLAKLYQSITSVIASRNVPVRLGTRLRPS